MLSQQLLALQPFMQVEQMAVAAAATPQLNGVVVVVPVSLVMEKALVFPIPFGMVE